MIKSIIKLIIMPITITVSSRKASAQLHKELVPMPTINHMSMIRTRTRPTSNLSTLKRKVKVVTIMEQVITTSGTWVAVRLVDCMVGIILTNTMLKPMAKEMIMEPVTTTSATQVAAIPVDILVTTRTPTCLNGRVLEMLIERKYKI
jgi:gamma-glutamyl:cysteine ligase YbdK (ATP-grasp superfamily)